MIFWYFVFCLQIITLCLFHQLVFALVRDQTTRRGRVRGSVFATAHPTRAALLLVAGFYSSVCFYGVYFQYPQPSISLGEFRRRRGQVLNIAHRKSLTCHTRGRTKILQLGRLCKIFMNTLV